ncbi:MAG TPA: LON peptidase substrate-binding domain-containing protein [Gemmatimonadales bacterium]|jgi:ATP-dependent Lon protease|nr:LON peptidase substrate-binding domain-containing protein [Gemmatimonadales bacterium]
MSRELAIFPLPLILFPGATQPLHIFEPRYRTLLSDCLAADRRFGITYAAPEAGSDPMPAPGDIGCIAHILNTQALPDGRSDILTTGEERFVLLDWIATDRPYRVARVEEFADDPGEAPEAEDLATDVRRDFLRVIEALEDDPPELPVDPEALSFRVAAALDLEAQGKLALLAIRSTTVRLRRLAALLQPLAADAERRAAVRRRGKSNGKGGPHARIERTS